MEKVSKTMLRRPRARRVADRSDLCVITKEVRAGGGANVEIAGGSASAGVFCVQLEVAPAVACAFVCQTRKVRITPRGRSGHAEKKMKKKRTGSPSRSITSHGRIQRGSNYEFL